MLWIAGGICAALAILTCLALAYFHKQGLLAWSVAFPFAVAYGAIAYIEGRSIVESIGFFASIAVIIILFYYEAHRK